MDDTDAAALDRDAEIVRHSEAMQEFMARAVLYQAAVAHAVGLNSTDLQTVGVLMARGPLTAGQLAAEIGLTSGGAITAAIDRLARAGYVRRDRDSIDRRRVLISATPETLMPKIGPLYARISVAWSHYLDTLSTAQISFSTELLTRAAEVNERATRELRP